MFSVISSLIYSPKSSWSTTFPFIADIRSCCLGSKLKDIARSTGHRVFLGWNFLVRVSNMEGGYVVYMALFQNVQYHFLPHILV